MEKTSQMMKKTKPSDSSDEQQLLDRMNAVR